MVEKPNTGKFIMPDMSKPQDAAKRQIKAQLALTERRSTGGTALRKFSWEK